MLTRRRPDDDPNSDAAPSNPLHSLDNPPRAQASDEELRQALAARHALCLDGRWRGVDPAYVGHVLELLLLTALERGWPRDALDGAEAAATLRAEGNVDPRWVPKKWRSLQLL